jgi:hypothetical protein
MQSSHSNKPAVREFYARIEQILVSGFLSGYGHNCELKSLVYSCLDDVILDCDKIKINGRIGVGSSSEVYKGSYLYCTMAIKKYNIQGYTDKQLVRYWLMLVPNLQ